MRPRSGAWLVRWPSRRIARGPETVLTPRMSAPILRGHISYQPGANMHIRATRIAVFAVIAAAPILSRASLIGAEKPESLIVQCARPCAGAIATVTSLGGTVTHVYEN